jgi:hypothetical protein
VAEDRAEQRAVERFMKPTGSNNKKERLHCNV